ncbi:MAG: hypothetical protein AB8C13_08460 [Phycisphaerales bacterium]
MHRLAYYQSLTIAQFHAAHLRDHGIMAGVIGTQANVIAPLIANNFGRGQYELYISTKRAKEHAQSLLDDLRQSQSSLTNNPQDHTHEPDIWDDNPEPDLTKLSSDHIPSCTTCNEKIAFPKHQGKCSTCNNPYDLAELVFDQFGPEALEPCYETSEPLAQYTDEQVASIDLDCPKCSYPLDGLGVEGACPECSTKFNRRDLFNDLLNQDSI